MVIMMWSVADMQHAHARCTMVSTRCRNDSRGSLAGDGLSNSSQKYDEVMSKPEGMVHDAMGYNILCTCLKILGTLASHAHRDTVSTTTPSTSLQHPYKSKLESVHRHRQTNTLPSSEGRT